MLQLSMDTLIKQTVRARLMLARRYAQEGWFDLAAIQLQLIKKELAAWRKEKTLVIAA